MQCLYDDKHISHFLHTDFSLQLINVKYLVNIIEQKCIKCLDN